MKAHVLVRIRMEHNRLRGFSRLLSYPGCCFCLRARRLPVFHFSSILRARVFFAPSTFSPCELSSLGGPFFWLEPFGYPARCTCVSLFDSIPFFLLFLSCRCNFSLPSPSQKKTSFLSHSHRKIRAIELFGVRGPRPFSIFQRRASTSRPIHFSPFFLSPGRVSVSWRASHPLFAPPVFISAFYWLWARRSGASRRASIKRRMKWEGIHSSLLLLASICPRDAPRGQLVFCIWWEEKGERLH